MKRESAFTLIEIIVTIIVIGISATALLSVFTNLVRGSADPVIQQQAATIAEAYLEEIMLRSFNDPQGGETQASEGESRNEYDDVKDYRDLAVGPPADQNGNPIAALAAYTVTVTVANASLNGITAGLDSLRVDVMVGHPAITAITLSGYRTRYSGP